MIPSFTIGSLGYAQKSDRPFVQDFANPKNTHKPLNPTTVRITDARPLRSQLNLETQGFALIDHKSTVADDLLEEESTHEVYVKELAGVVSDIAKEPDLVLPCGAMMLRFSVNAPLNLRKRIVRIAGIKPSNDVHMDFSTKSFCANADHALEIAGMDRVRYSRVMAIQTWRALSDPPHDFPLALTDNRSVKPGSYVLMQNITDAQGSVAETRMALRDDGHAWYYFSDLRKDELVVFKGFDGAFPESFNLFHAAFDNTVAQPHANPRSSVEMRFLAFWK
jgi:hypothetical protein